MPDIRWREIPPLFLAGVTINWIAMGVLAWEPRWVMAIVALLVIGTGTMFVAGYTHRPTKH